jgi:branched-chain amino acid transport system permease protein
MRGDGSQSTLGGKMNLASQLLQYTLSGITIGSIYAMVALGFNIIYNSTGIINFAQGDFVMIGGMLVVYLHKTLHFPLLFAGIMTVIIVSCIGIGFERLAIHPLKNPSVITLIIITIAASILFKGGAMFIWGKDSFFLPSFSGDEPIKLMSATILPQSLWILSFLFLIVMALMCFFRFRMVGKAMKACSYNKRAASIVGINVHSMVMISFALSALIGGIAGVIVTPITLVDYDRGSLLGLKGFGAAIFGGLGNMGGAVVAGIIIGLLESYSAGLLSSGYKDAVALVILLLVLFLRPGGIFASKEVQKLKIY